MEERKILRFIFGKLLSRSWLCSLSLMTSSRRPSFFTATLAASPSALIKAARRSRTRLQLRSISSIFARISRSAAQTRLNSSNCEVSAAVYKLFKMKIWASYVLKRPTHRIIGHKFLGDYVAIEALKKRKMKRDPGELTLVVYERVRRVFAGCSVKVAHNFAATNWQQTLQKKKKMLVVKCLIVHNRSPPLSTKP